MATKAEKDQRWRLMLDFPSKDALLDFVDEMNLPGDAKAHHADGLDKTKPCHKVVVTRDRHYGAVARDEGYDTGEAYMARWRKEQEAIDHEIEHGVIGIDKPPLFADRKEDA
jgi:hypothetical protein